MKTAKLRFSLMSGAEQNAKLSKNATRSAYLALMPHKGASTKAFPVNVCPHASPSCPRECVAFAGRGRSPNVTKARIRKTRFFARNRRAFLDSLRADLNMFANSGGGLVRLNAYSDLPWERWIDLGAFRGVEFYDYTKDARRALRNAQEAPANFSLCYSVSESTRPGVAAEILRAGGSVAVVVDLPRNAPKPTSWIIDGKAFPAIDGDADDDRRRSRCGGRVVLLAWKGSNDGKAEAIAAGFCKSTPAALTVSAKGGKP